MEGQTDRQTDGDTSARVELRFAAKNFKNLDKWQIRGREGKLNPNFLVNKHCKVLVSCSARVAVIS